MVESELKDKIAFSVEECAQKISISKGLCYELIRQGKLPALRLGERRLVVPKAALLKFMADQSNGENAEA